MREATNEIDSCRNKIQSLAYRLTLEPFNRVEIAMKWKMYCQFDEQKDILREKARKWLQDLNGIKTGLLMGEICLDRSGGSTEDEDGDE